MDYLKSQSSTTGNSSNTGDIHSVYMELQQDYEKQLWYQFSEKLIDIIHNKSFSTHLYDLYINTIQSIQFKLNQINLCRYIVYTLKQIDTNQQKIKLLKQIESDISNHIANLKKQTKISQVELNEYIYTQLIISSQCISIQINELGQPDKIEPLKDIIDSNIITLNNFSHTLDPYIHSNIYYSQLIYYKYVGPATVYFNSALNYLIYVDINELTPVEQNELSYDIGIAALLGDNIYNYGELLSHPLIRTLQSNHNNSWLYELLVTCNNGEIQKFESSYKSNSSKSNALQGTGKQEFLYEKVRIMSLINTIFQRNSNARTITFNDIASICKIKLNYVEWLLMKSLSLGVIKGEISEIQQTIRITWVQPRVLNIEQIHQITTKLNIWNNELDKNITFLEQNGAELIKVNN